MTRKILLVVAAAVLGAACGDHGTEAGNEPVASVQVTAPAPSLEVGTTLQLLAAATGRDGQVLTGRTVTWSSSDTLLAVVSPSGLVSARAAGAVTIRAASEGREGQTALVVVPQPVAWVQITPGGDLVQAPGTTLQLVTVARAGDGTELTGRVATWTSSDTAVAVVSPAGVLTARGVGSARITATVEGKVAEARVMVPTLIDRIELDTATLMMGDGDERPLVARARALDGTPLERAFTWTSSSSTVASVSAAGVVRGVGSGTALITVHSEGRSASVQVRVGSWSRRPLVAVGDSALPASAFRKTTTDAAGVTRTVRYDATAGQLRTLGLTGRYELRIDGFLISPDSPPVAAAYVSRGTVMHDVWTGEMVLHPESGLPSFRGRFREDGTLEVLWRPEPAAPTLAWRFAAP